MFESRILSAIAALLPAVALAGEMPPPDMKNADFGPIPTDYETLVKAWAAANLKDPESARFGAISKPRKEYMYASSRPFYGYSVCAAINAKNSYGGYTGNQTFWFLIRDGKIARAQNTDQPLVAGLVPGTTISQGHVVNCSDGDADGN